MRKTACLTALDALLCVNEVPTAFVAQRVQGAVAEKAVAVLLRNA
jgi:hypothetical protein